MIHVRVKGAVVQKNLNINATPSTVAREAETLTEEELRDRMRELERRDRAATNGGSEKVVEAEIVE